MISFANGNSLAAGHIVARSGEGAEREAPLVRWLLAPVQDRPAG